MTEQVHKLGEVLRTAREAKGVDLTKVERDTKIRERYLSALERGEYRELPGAVYTKGFLRNYGAYLGLDPEYLIDLYRLETVLGPSERAGAPTAPRPIAVRRSRNLVVSAGAVAGTILTLVVAVLIVWIAYELINFARTPELRVIEPPGNVADHTGETITFRGVTSANATVTVAGLTENPSVTADASGNFEITVDLRPGSNEIHLVARDPVTNRDSDEVVRTVLVGRPDVASSPTPSAVVLALTQPAADAILTGPVPVAGTGPPGVALQLTAALITAPTPTFAVADPAGTAVGIAPTPPSAPPPATLGIDTTGAFTGSLALAPGTWDVAVTAAGGEPVTRRVTVQPAAGLSGALRLEGGPSYLEIDQDGVPLASVSGTIADDGQSVALSATGELRIRAGNAGAIRLTINGITIGAMGGGGSVVEWRITRSGS